jgi:hypothetical protein
MTAPADPRTGAWDTTAGDRLRRWRPTRGGILVAALLLLALTVLAIAAPRRTGYLDPAAVDPSGSRAVASVLRDLGVTVTDVRTTADVTANARAATVLVAIPGLLTTGMVGELLDAGPRRVVLVDALASDPIAQRLAAGVELAEPVGADPRPPGCDLRAATRAGTAVLPGISYDAKAWPGAALCYSGPGAATLVVLPARDGRPEVVLLGSGHPLTNDGFDEEGNAALSLDLLGADPQLVWWRPSAADPALAEQDGSLADLLPPWVVPALVQLGIATLLVVWWRGRRLGPLVVEPLPVVIPAGETTEGHARLLHAQRARGEAATHLRASARERLRRRLGLPLGCAATDLVGAAAGRSGRPPEGVGDLLYGPEPPDDAGLVALGPDLEALITEVGGA